MRHWCASASTSDGAIHATCWPANTPPGLVNGEPANPHASSTSSPGNGTAGVSAASGPESQNQSQADTQTDSQTLTSSPAVPKLDSEREIGSATKAQPNTPELTRHFSTLLRAQTLVADPPSESPPESPYEAPSEAPSSPPSTYSAYKPPLLPTKYTTTPKKASTPAHKVKVKGKVAKDKGKDKGKEKGKDKVKAQPPKKLGPIPEYPGIGKKPLIKYGNCTVYFSPPAEVRRVKPATGS